jgi:5-methylcytosine-specific restriction endonuclease McrA
MALPINIPSKNTITDNNIHIKLIEPKTLLRLINEKTIEIPQFQRELCEIKINTIVDKIIKNSSKNWLLLQGRISLGYIINTQKLYILDGQHRIKAIDKIISQQSELGNEIYNKTIEIIIIKFNDISEMKDYFVDINSNSKIEPIYTYFNDEMIQSSILKLRGWLKENYNMSFRKFEKKSENNKNYHLNEFIRLFTPDNVKHFYDNLQENYGNETIIIEKLMLANISAKEQLQGFSKKGKRNCYVCDKEYDKCLMSGFYLAYENINSIDFIFGYSDDVEIKEITHNNKIKITSKMRKDVWKKRNGNLMNGKCYICNDDMEFDAFHCGHIIADKIGGLLVLSNLEPICMGCNLSMGTKNLNTYKDELNKFRHDLNYVSNLSHEIN